MITSDVQQLSVVKEDVPPEQQVWNPIVDQEEPEPEPPHIKEELWTSQEVNITRFSSTSVPVKSEDDDEEKVKSSQLDQTQTEENKVEANIVDCGGSEPSSSFHPYRHLQRKTDDQNEDSEETEDSDEDQTLNHKPESKRPTNSSTEQMETETHETSSTGDATKKTDLTLSDVAYEKKCYDCSVCSKPFARKSHLQSHMRIHTGEKPFCCSLCGRRFTHKSTLRNHMIAHTGEKPLKCSMCHKRFRDKSEVSRHMRIHTGERLFGCSECNKRFTWKLDLDRHMMFHTGERPFSCEVCQKKFTRKYNLQKHMRIHTRHKKALTSTDKAVS